MTAIDGNNNSITTSKKVKILIPPKKSLLPFKVKKPSAQKIKEAGQSAKTIKSMQAQLEAPPPLTDLSKDEEAFMVLLDLNRKEYSAIKSLCKLKKTDSFGGLIQKVMQTDEKNHFTSPHLIKHLRKAKIAYIEFLKYQQEKSNLFTELKLMRADLFKPIEKRRNEFISPAFIDTLNLHRNSKEFKRYFDILKKFEILDPLNVSRKILYRMSIYEECQFTEKTEILKYIAVSNLSFNELMRYKDLEKRNGQVEDDYITKAIKFGRKELLPIRQRELKAEEILNSKPEDKKIVIDALTREAQSIIKKYEQARADLKAALETKGINDDAQAKERLKAILAELISEIEKEYTNAFVETPSQPEKQALKDLLMATAELEIIDKEIIYYARLSNDVLKREERQIIDKLKKNGIQFSKQKVIPQDLTNLTAKTWIESYPKEVQPILTKYVEDTRKYLETCCNVNEIWIGKGKDHGNALFFALRSIGFSESELLLLGAMVAYETLDTPTKVILEQDTLEKSQRACWREYKRLIKIKDADNFNKLSDAERGRILQGIEALGMTLFGLVGSSIEADYLLSIHAYDKKTGLRLESDLWRAELTPEAYDDLIMRREIKNLFKNGAEYYGLDPLSIINIHIYIRSITNELKDDNFINEILQHSSLYGLMTLNGQYGLDTFKQEFVQCITNRALEYHLEKKEYFDKSKNEIKKWLTKFVKQIREDVDNKSNYAGTSEMANKIAILGSIYTLLTEFKIMNDDEFLKFYEKNPIISVKNNLTIEDLKKGNVYHTVGYQSIPNEIKSKIEQSTFSGFCNKYSDLLNIYWVPYGNASFGGYANRDKNTIVIVYESPQGKQRKPSMNSIELSTEIIVHELKHKVDMLELREYSASHPDHKFPFFYVPSLITERNAYLTGLWLCDEFPAKTPEIIKRKKILKELLAKANLLLGLPEDNEDYLHPPYEGIDLHSVALQIDPATISWLPLKVVKTILNTLDKLGYNQEEKKWLFERCMLIAAGKPIDLGYVKAGRRDLLVDFLGKLIGVEKTKTGGFLTLGFLEVFTNIKKNIKDPSGKTIVSLHLLLALLGHHLKKQESKK